MSINLTPDQEQFIHTKLQTGKYRSAEEVLATALRLLDEHDRDESEWVRQVREKVDAAVATAEHTPSMNGEVVVDRILKRLRQVRQVEG